MVFKVINPTRGRNTQDYWTTFFSDLDGIRLEITNYREERQERHDYWQSPGLDDSG